MQTLKNKFMKTAILLIGMFLSISANAQTLKIKIDPSEVKKNAHYMHIDFGAIRDSFVSIKYKIIDSNNVLIARGDTTISASYLSIVSEYPIKLEDLDTLLALWGMTAIKLEN